jgi:hypothetical protein
MRAPALSDRRDGRGARPRRGAAGKEWSVFGLDRAAGVPCGTSGERYTPLGARESQGGVILALGAAGGIVKHRALRGVMRFESRRTAARVAGMSE